MTNKIHRRFLTGLLLTGKYNKNGRLKLVIDYIKTTSNGVECYFCKKNIQSIDFKEQELLRHFVSGLGKIRPKKRTGVCSKHQRKLANAIKRARHLGLLL